MHAVHRPATSLALHGVDASRRIERQAQAALAPHTLMRRAGLAVARLALAIAPHARRVWVAAGPGNNGGDGFEAAMHLLQAGKPVVVSFAGDAARLPADAADALARAQAAGVAIVGAGDAPRGLGAQDIAIDALLGLGASRAPEGEIADLVARLNDLACPVLAVDLPSGLEAMTGQPLGMACVRATQTLSLLTLKPGLFTGQGRDCAGTPWFDDLGVDSAATPPDAWLSGADVAVQLARRHASHKGSYGDVAIVGGAPGMTGAALLAARAAHAAGAGRVFVSLVEPDAPGQQLALDPVRPELMFRHAWWQSAPAVLAGATVVAGCGGGDAVRHVLPPLLSRVPRLVLDADALNAIAADPALQAQLQARAARAQATILTPHPLEAARMLGCDAATVQADRLRSAQALAERWRCVVLLKGSGSIVAAPGLVPHVNPTGHAALASAGTGDVLAGWMGGLWAQLGAPDRAFAAARSAAWLHGAAAEGAPAGPLRAADLVEAMSRAARGLS